jgi:hypothetical protein
LVWLKIRKKREIFFPFLFNCRDSGMLYQGRPPPGKIGAFKFFLIRKGGGVFSTVVDKYL